MYLAPEKEREMRNNLHKLDASQNADIFHRVLRYAMTYLDYRGEESPMVIYDRRAKERKPIERSGAEKDIDPKTIIFLREESYQKNGTTIKIRTSYLTSARVRGKKASWWFIEANSDLGITRSVVNKSGLIKRIVTGMKEFKTDEKKANYGREMIEGILEKAIIMGANGIYYISFTDIDELVKAHKD